LVDYRIVKYCGLCKKRFVVNKGENKKIYCEDCYQKVLKYRQNEANKAEIKESESDKKSK